jgi:hypothetical protein
MLTIFTSTAFGQWSAQIQATGKQLGGQYKSQVSIGVANEASQMIAPPKVPEFSCFMTIKSDDWMTNLAKKIHQNDDNDNAWIIGINPKGNMGNDLTGSSTISWNPQQLGPGNFEIRKGYSESGELIVSDMKQTSSFDVFGENEELYFIIINTH